MFQKHNNSNKNSKQPKLKKNEFIPSEKTQEYLNYISGSDPSHFCMVPNFIDHLTYDHFDEKTKTTKIKRLSVHAKELYRVLKIYAGEYGKSWASTKALAETCNMSVGQVSKAKKELSQKFHQLGGNPLIFIEQLQKSKVKDGNVVSKTKYDQITIPNVWNYNKEYVFQKAKAKQENVCYTFNEHEGGARSPHESEGGTRSPHEHAPQEARSPYEPNNIHKNNNHMFNEQNTTAAAASVVLQKEKENVSSLDSTESLQIEAYHWMVKHGCQEKIAFRLSRRYPIDEISNASLYLLNQTKKPNFSFKKDKWAYFQDILYNKYWTSSKSDKNIF